jgi:hypothetical protein
MPVRLSNVRSSVNSETMLLIVDIYVQTILALRLMDPYVASRGLGKQESLDMAKVLEAGLVSTVMHSP